MEQHYIICGVKDIGIFVAKELCETKHPFVVIDESLPAIEALREALVADPFFVAGQESREVAKRE